MHCIVFSTLFQSVLMTTLVAPKYYPDVDTLQDLYKTDIKIHVAHFSLVHLRRGLAAENEQFLKHLIEVPKNITVYGETLDWIEMYRHTTGILVSTEQVYYLKTTSKNSERPDFHVMKDTVMPNAQAYNIREEKLFYEEILDAMGRIRQAGLYLHWRKYNYDIDLKSVYNITEVKEESEIGNDNKSLTIEHLQVSFLFLFFGGFAAAIVFCCEVIYRKKCNKY